MRKKLTIAALLISVSFWLSYLIASPVMPKDGGYPALYCNSTRDDLKLLFAHAIDSSKKSVFLKIYSLRDPLLIRKLREKSETGIPVTVICDAKASKGVGRKLGPLVNTTYQSDKGIMHQKILMVDEKNIWIGSANFTSESLRMHSNLVVGIQNSQLADWILHNHDRPGQKEQFQIGGQHLEIWMTRDNPASVQRLQQLMKEAKKTMKVAMFAWTREDFAASLGEAKNRGLQTSVILDRNASRGIGRKVADLLIREGVPVGVKDSAGLMHHKLLLLDDETLVCGSANWTKAAFSLNTDCFIILHGLNKSQKAKLKKMWHILESESKPAVVLQ